MQQDTLQLSGIELPNGTRLSQDWYGVRGLDDIEAMYELIDGRITVIDHGVLGRDDLTTIMTDAPTHYLVHCGNYSGSIQLDNYPNYNLNFVNNVLVSIT